MNDLRGFFLKVFEDFDNRTIPYWGHHLVSQGSHPDYPIAIMACLFCGEQAWVSSLGAQGQIEQEQCSARPHRSLMNDVRSLNWVKGWQRWRR